jgi:hypothetical protein
MKEKYPIYVSWSETLDWLLDRTERFPKSVRFSLSGRIAALGLDVMERIVEAIYSRRRAHILRQLNLDLEKLRVLLGISYRRRYISCRQYAYISAKIDETGKMAGGWAKQS